MQVARLTPPPLFDFGAPAPKPDATPAADGGPDDWRAANAIAREVVDAGNALTIDAIRDRHADTLAKLKHERPGIARALSHVFADRRAALRPEWEV